MTNPTSDSSIASRARLLITLSGTILVVFVEFLLLIGVYYHGQTLEKDSLALADFNGRAKSAAPGVAVTALAQAADETAATLSKHGVSATQVSVLTSAAAAAEAAPLQPASLDGLRAAGASMNAVLQGRQHRRDDESKAIYAGLLIFASVGWMVWFRRLVSRHRALQREVTEQLSLAVGEQRLAALIRNSADLVVVCDPDSTVRFATASSLTVIGVEPDDLVGGRLAELVDPDFAERFLRALATDAPSLTMRLRHSAGHYIDTEGSVTSLIDDPSVGGMVLNIRDVTERLQLQEQLSRQTFVDSLSGLANRQLFADRLGHALERRSSLDQPLVVLMCDLDDFKDINDSLGHGIGDDVIAVIGERLNGVIRAGDTAARLGGDEFAILMEATDIPGAQLVAERLLAEISEPIVLPTTTLTLHASIGLAQAIPGETNISDTLRNVDVAMYQAKAQGKGRIAVYESRLHAEALDRLELRADLSDALRSDDGLVLYYQPTVDMRTNEVIGYEALIRWQHPTRGLLPPGLFIPMAEECGLIAPLGSWVLTQACQAAVLMTPRAGSSGRIPSMAINVASEQLAQADFVDEVLVALRASGLDSGRLTLEITEGVVLDDLETIAPRLLALRELGVRIAIDDFGTGYSSLAYLSHLPVDVLKVDKSFVDRVMIDEQDASVTAAIIAMGKTMNMTIVAEGVEHSDQASWLRGVSCDVGQGYVWSRPVPFEQARELAGATIHIDGVDEPGPAASATESDAARAV